MNNSLFEISSVEWQFKEFQGIGSSQRIRTNISAMTVHCKSCDSKWRSTEDGHQPGMFHAFIGGVQLICPKCKANGQVAQGILDKL